MTSLARARPPRASARSFDAIAGVPRCLRNGFPPLLEESFTVARFSARRDYSTKT